MLSLLIATYLIVEPVITMRKEPSFTSEVVSEALFAEEVELLAEKNGWRYIQTSDGYQGWIDSFGLSFLETPYEATLATTRLKAHLYHLPTVSYGPILSLPYGSKLLLLDESDPRWLHVLLPHGTSCYIQRGDVAPLKRVSLSDLPALAQRFLDLPYTWGGRSSFGFDCSGFVQMLYREAGIQLPRDAKDQFLDRRFKAVEKPRSSDLIFFGRSEKEIVHVGLLLDEETFIHATVKENQPWIRISRLQDPEWNLLPYRSFSRYEVCEEP